MKKATSKPRLLGREQILAHVAEEVREVFVDGWNASVRVRVPTLEKIAELKMRFPDPMEMQRALIVACCVDLTPADVAKLADGNGVKLAQLINAVGQSGGLVSDAGVGN